MKLFFRKDLQIKQNSKDTQSSQIDKKSKDTQNSHNKQNSQIKQKTSYIKERIIYFAKIIQTFSLIEKKLKKTAQLKDKEVEKHKFNSLKLSIFIGLFGWLFLGVLLKNIILAGAFGAIIIALAFVLLIQLPLIKKRNYAKKIEAELPLFLLRLATEIRLGKNFSTAIKDLSKGNDCVSKEFEKVVYDLHKGASFSESLNKMNERLNSAQIRRALSNLNNIQNQGSKDTSGLKKLAEEMLLKQRIESKEFSGKMTVYALVFIAVSAIVPAMFQSFLLIGSYFMSIQFTPIEAFLICVIGFPAIDASVLFMIESKTPVFLRT
jgi:archaeal flagellar protein FlaJ